MKMNSLIVDYMLFKKKKPGKYMLILKITATASKKLKLINTG